MDAEGEKLRRCCWCRRRIRRRARSRGADGAILLLWGPMVWGLDRASQRLCDGCNHRVMLVGVALAAFVAFFAAAVVHGPGLVE